MTRLSFKRSKRLLALALSLLLSGHAGFIAGTAGGFPFLPAVPVAASPVNFSEQALAPRSLLSVRAFLAFIGERKVVSSLVAAAVSVPTFAQTMARTTVAAVQQVTQTTIDFVNPTHVIIQQGMNLTRYAEQYHTSVSTLLSWNPQIADPNLIITGHGLVVPVIHQMSVAAPGLSHMPMMTYVNYLGMPIDFWMQMGHIAFWVGIAFLSTGILFGLWRSIQGKARKKGKLAMAVLALTIGALLYINPFQEHSKEPTSVPAPTAMTHLLPMPPDPAPVLPETPPRFSVHQDVAVPAEPERTPVSTIVDTVVPEPASEDSPFVQGVVERVDGDFLTVHHKVIPKMMGEMTMSFSYGSEKVRQRASALLPGETIEFRVKRGQPGEFIITDIQSGTPQETFVQSQADNPTEAKIQAQEAPPLEKLWETPDVTGTDDSLDRWAESAIRAVLSNTALANKKDETNLALEKAKTKPSIRLGMFARVEPMYVRAGPQVEFKTLWPGSLSVRQANRDIQVQKTRSQVNSDQTLHTTVDQWLDAYAQLLSALNQARDYRHWLMLAQDRSPQLTAWLEERRADANARAHSAAMAMIAASGPAAKGISTETLLTWAQAGTADRLFENIQPYFRTGETEANAAALHLKESLAKIQERSDGALTSFLRKLEVHAQIPAPLWSVITFNWKPSPSADWKELQGAWDASIQLWENERYASFDAAAADAVLAEEGHRLENETRDRIAQHWNEVWSSDLSSEEATRRWFELSDDLARVRQAEAQWQLAEWRLRGRGIKPGASMDVIQQTIGQAYAAPLPGVLVSIRDFVISLQKKKPGPAAGLIAALQRTDGLTESRISRTEPDPLPEASALAGAFDVGPVPSKGIDAMTSLASPLSNVRPQAPDAPIREHGQATVSAGLQIRHANDRVSVQDLVRELKYWRSLEERNQALFNLQERILQARKDKVQVEALKLLEGALLAEHEVSSSEARREEIEATRSVNQAELHVRQARLERYAGSSQLSPGADLNRSVAEYEAGFRSVLIARRSSREWTLNVMAQASDAGSLHSMLSWDPGSARIAQLFHQKERPEVVWAESEKQWALSEIRGRYALAMLRAEAAAATLDDTRASFELVEQERQTAESNDDLAPAARDRSEAADAYRRVQEAEVEDDFARKQLEAWGALFEVHEGSLSPAAQELRRALADIRQSQFDPRNPPSITTLAVQTAALKGLEPFLISRNFSIALTGSFMKDGESHSWMPGAFFQYRQLTAERQAEEARLSSDASITAVDAFENALEHQKQQAETKARISGDRGLAITLSEWLASADITPEGRLEAERVIRLARESAAKDAAARGFVLNTVEPTRFDQPVEVPQLVDPLGAAAMVAERCTCGTFEGTISPDQRSRWGWQVTSFAGIMPSLGVTFWDRNLWDPTRKPAENAWAANEEWRKVAISDTNKIRMKARMVAQDDEIGAKAQAWKLAVAAVRQETGHDVSAVRALVQAAKEREELSAAAKRQEIDLSQLDPGQWEPNGITMVEQHPGDLKGSVDKAPVVLHRTFEGHGIIQGIDVANGILIIKHGPIEGFMETSMTMPFTVDPAIRPQLQALHKGNTIDFTVSIVSDARFISALSPSANKGIEAAVSRLSGDWLLEDLNGRQIHLEELKGKILFINHWATWCPNCAAEMENIERLMNRYKGRDDVAFLLVTDEAPDIVRAFIKEHRLPPVLIAKSSTPKVLESYALPATFVVSHDGTVVYQKIGYADWEKEAPAILNRWLSRVGVVLPPTSSFLRSAA